MARRLGARVYALPEDIVEVKNKIKNFEGKCNWSDLEIDYKNYPFVGEAEDGDDCVCGPYVTWFCTQHGRQKVKNPPIETKGSDDDIRIFEVEDCRLRDISRRYIITKKHLQWQYSTLLWQ